MQRPALPAAWLRADAGQPSLDHPCKQWEILCCIMPGYSIYSKKISGAIIPPEPLDGSPDEAVRCGCRRHETTVRVSRFGELGMQITVNGGAPIPYTHFERLCQADVPQHLLGL